MQDIGIGYAQRRDEALDTATNLHMNLIALIHDKRYGPAAEAARAMSESLHRAHTEQVLGETAREARGLSGR